MKYNTPSRSVTDDDGDSISHLEWETVRVSSIFPNQSENGEIILLLSPFRNTMITMILSRWGSSRRARWRSWWSPWQATPGSSSPPTSTSSSPPIGLSLRPNKCSTYSQKGKQFFWIFWWVSSCHNYDWYSEPRWFWDLGLTPGYTCGVGEWGCLRFHRTCLEEFVRPPNLPFFTSLFTLMSSIYNHQYI